MTTLGRCPHPTSNVKLFLLCLKRKACRTLHKDIRVKIGKMIMEDMGYIKCRHCDIFCCKECANIVCKGLIYSETAYIACISHYIKHRSSIEKFIDNVHDEMDPTVISKVSESARYKYGFLGSYVSDYEKEFYKGWRRLHKTRGYHIDENFSNTEKLEPIHYLSFLIYIYQTVEFIYDKRLP